MPTIVTGNCERCRFTDCVTVCPVACFHGDDQMLYIDNNVCIDCGACIPTCPVQAIYEEADLPGELRVWIAITRSALPISRASPRNRSRCRGRRRAKRTGGSDRMSAGS